MERSKPPEAPRRTRRSFLQRLRQRPPPLPPRTGGEGAAPQRAHSTRKTFFRSPMDFLLRPAHNKPRPEKQAREALKIRGNTRVYIHCSGAVRRPSRKRTNARPLYDVLSGTIVPYSPQASAQPRLQQNHLNFLSGPHGKEGVHFIQMFRRSPLTRVSEMFIIYLLNQSISLESTRHTTNSP